MPMQQLLLLPPLQQPQPTQRTPMASAESRWSWCCKSQPALDHHRRRRCRLQDPRGSPAPNWFCPARTPCRFLRSLQHRTLSVLMLAHSPRDRSTTDNQTQVDNQIKVDLVEGIRTDIAMQAIARSSNPRSSSFRQRIKVTHKTK